MLILNFRLTASSADCPAPKWAQFGRTCLLAEDEILQLNENNIIRWWAILDLNQ
jgi:hypothetical protein